MAITDRYLVDGGGGVDGPSLTPAQLQAATRKLSQGQPLTDAEKIALGVPISVSAAAQVSEVLSGPVGEDDPRYYTVKVGTTGKTSAQLAAFQNATNTASMINEAEKLVGFSTQIISEKTGS